MNTKLTAIIIACSAIALNACKSDSAKQEEQKRDSVELQKVDEMIKNEDSLVKEKEKQLKEQYGL